MDFFEKKTRTDELFHGFVFVGLKKYIASHLTFENIYIHNYVNIDYWINQNIFALWCFAKKSCYVTFKDYDKTIWGGGGEVEVVVEWKAESSITIKGCQ